MKNLKKLLVMLMVMTLTIGLVGCGTKEADTSKNPETSKENQETSQTTEVTYPVDITDSNGTKITLDQEPAKIVSVAPNITQMIFAIGAGDKVVGRTDYCDYPAEVSDIESIGTLRQPNIEKIIELQPDIVIASTHFEEETEKKLADAGIKVAVLYEEHDVTGVYTMIDTMGTIVNKKAEADQVIADMKATFDEVAQAVKDQKHPSVYYVVGYGEGGDFTAGGDTFINGLITMAGGDNIAKDVEGWSYSKETLLEKDPDVIIVDLGQVEDFKKTEGYSELTAVKEGRVYEFDTKRYFNQQGCRNAEGVKELAKILYPDQVK